jgi:uncharacterized protein (TIGR03083 family)
MTSLPAESYDLRTLLAAWEDGLHAVVELGRRLTTEQWQARTECPGWSAGDVVRHLSWVESFLAGRPAQEHEVDWERFPHITSDFGRLTEVGVDARRARGQDEVCDELDALIDVRLSQLMSVEPFDLMTDVPGLFGKPVPLHSLLRVRVLDIWTHEQDIRRATGLPANLATDAAHVAAAQLVRSLPFVLARNLEAPPGAAMRVTVTGPIAFERWSVVDEEGRGAALDDLGAPDDPAVGLSTDWETFARLGTGRLDVGDPDIRSRITLTGDPSLADRLPTALAITP